MSFKWWVALGAIGLLGYELYKRLTPTPTKVAAPAGAAPAEQRQATGSLESPPMFLGAAGKMRLHKGQRYRMRYHQPSFSPSSLQGMTRLTLYPSPGSLPRDWPPVAAGQDDTATAFAAGTWDAPDAQIEKPYGLWQIWPTDSTLT
jgi:hypothetical protein